MIVIVVKGGVVQEVYSDDPDEDVKVLDFDNAEDPDAEVPPEQLRREVQMIEREMHQVL
jgi:hypothetical protein